MADKKVLFLISGQQQHGKDSLADALGDVLARGTTWAIVGDKTYGGMARAALADPLKEVAILVFNMPREVAYGGEEERRAWKHWVEAEGREMDAREILRWIGTEFGRRLIHKDIWIWRLIDRVAGRSVYYGPMNAAVVTVTDCRFKNELSDLGDSLAEHGWTVVKIRIRRPGLENAEAHASESEQLQIPDGYFDELVINDAGLEKLRNIAAALVDNYCL